MEPVPTTRRLREFGERLQTTDRRIHEGIRRGARRASESRFVQWLQRIGSGIKTFFDILALSVILIYDIFKYAFITFIVVLAVVGVYYAFKYVLLFFIWAQNLFA